MIGFGGRSAAADAVLGAASFTRPFRLFLCLLLCLTLASAALSPVHAQRLGERLGGLPKLYPARQFIAHTQGCRHSCRGSHVLVANQLNAYLCGLSLAALLFVSHS